MALLDERSSLKELLGTVGSDAELASSVQATLVVIADDFALGEPLFFEVLKQWRENHAEARFDRLCVPLLRGQVRFGLRLVPAERISFTLTGSRTLRSR